MSVVIVDDIPHLLTREEMLDRLAVHPETALGTKLGQLLHQACAIAEPKTLHRVCRARPGGDTRVVVDGVILDSPILRRHLDCVSWVIPYIVTSGRELWEWSRTLETAIDRSWAAVIIEAMLNTAVDQFEEVLRKRCGTGPMSSLHPGSLSDWPLRDQVGLFQLLHDPSKLIGVELTDGLFMAPPATVSGLRFETESEHQHRCELCTRSSCPKRARLLTTAAFGSAVDGTSCWGGEARMRVLERRPRWLRVPGLIHTD